ncbi:MAG: DUF362 domain-containing protein [Candidatus Thorarchaeota archaeon]|nr:MAG: DUF362 domain-containing protein [Candidatus Thorarchaeota archaeon]
MADIVGVDSFMSCKSRPMALEDGFIQDEKERKSRRWFLRIGCIAVASAVWLALRTGLRPARIVYPCQQAALSNIQMFKMSVLALLPTTVSMRSTTTLMKPALVLTILSVGSFFLVADPFIFDSALQQSEDDYARVPISLAPHIAPTTGAASDLFFVQNATGYEGNLDDAVSELLDIMATQGVGFFESITTPDGLIGSNDVVIIKVNGQWDYRGGTNTDLVKSIIKTILSHPSGFTGEVIIADNGQGIGDLDRNWANAYHRNQSAQDVVDLFAPDYDVSSILWDNLHEFTVDDYDDGDYTDGYVRSSDWNEETQMFVSYPKFRSSATGAYISFKEGVWSNTTGFDSDRLKVINVPVLKSHELYGVTACVKHYMGVPQGYIVSSVHESAPHEHFSVALGGMGTLMVETRAPVLNILDMIWVNAHPLESSLQRGPWSAYPAARFTDILGASTDPVALDYWSAKHVLMPTSAYLNYSAFSSLDPDNESIVEHILYPYVQQEESFHNYLTRSMSVMNDSGFQVTMNPDEINVFVSTLPDRPITYTVSEPPNPIDYLPLVLVPIAAGVLVVLVAMVRKQSK